MFEKLLTGFGYWQPMSALFSTLLVFLFLPLFFSTLGFLLPSSASRRRIAENLIANWEESIHLMDSEAGRLEPPKHPLKEGEEEDYGAHGRRFCLLLLVFISAVFWS